MKAQHADVELGAVMDGRQVFPLFQPVVALDSGEIIGFEALARGPEGPLHTPDSLFRAARESGRLAELDGLCQRRALESAERAGLRSPFTVFVNVEPAGMTDEGPIPELLAVGQHDRLPLVVEITERALLDDPARLLGFAEALRAAQVGLALDDVGADPASLALMPFLRPDVVKLDLRLVQGRSDSEVAQIMTAVTAYAEESGCTVVAEGVETERHEHVARSMGATHAQGWRYGRPRVLTNDSLPSTHGRTAPWLSWEVSAPQPLWLDSPFAVGAVHRKPLQGTKTLLTELSRLLEEQARGVQGPVVILAAFEDARHVGGPALQRYSELAERATMVVVFGTDLAPEPAPGIRGTDLARDDPLRDEWHVVVLGPHFAAALVAHDLRKEALDHDRLFDYVLTYDRAIVTAMARTLMARTLIR